LQVELIKRHRALSAESKDRRARAPRHPPVDQRRGRPAQHGLTRRAASDSRAGTARAGLCFPRKNILKNNNWHYTSAYTFPHSGATRTAAGQP
jgi:hypothetical protein